MSNLQEGAAPQQPQSALVSSSIASGSSTTKLQPLRLRIEVTAALGSDSAAGGHHSDPAASPGPSPGPSSPLSAKTKWNAILQRLHTNTAQLLNRKLPAASPGGAAAELPPSPSAEKQQELSQQALPREFNEWGSLKQRLREVKQSAQQRKPEAQPDSQQLELLPPQRNVTHNTDDSLIVVSGTSSAMEAEIEQLLAQPLLPPAVTAAAAAARAAPTAADGGTAAGTTTGAGAKPAGGGTLNLHVRRFRSPGFLLTSPLPSSTAAPASSTGTAAAPTSVVAGADGTAGDGAIVAAGVGKGASAGARRTNLRLELPQAANSSSSIRPHAGTAAASCTDSSSSSAVGALTGATTTAEGALAAAADMRGTVDGLGMRRRSSALTNNPTVSITDANAAGRLTAAEILDGAAHALANPSNNSTRGSTTSSAVPLDRANASGGDVSSPECSRSVATPSCDSSTTPAAGARAACTAGDKSQCRWHQAATAGHPAPGTAAAAAAASASCSDALVSQATAWAGAAAAAAPASATLPAALARDQAAATAVAAAAAAAAAAAPESVLIMQLPPSRFPQTIIGGCSTTAPADAAAALAMVPLSAAAAARTSVAAADVTAAADRRRTSRTVPHIFASFKLPAHLYSSQEDILNDADIRALLGRVEAACGSRREGPAGGTSAAAASPCAVPNVHWHRKESSSFAECQRSNNSSSSSIQKFTRCADRNAAEAAGNMSESRIHVHVDEDADGQLSVVISDMDQEPDNAAAAAVTTQQPVFRSSLRSSVSSQRQLEQQQHAAAAAAEGEAVLNRPPKRSSAGPTASILSQMPASTAAAQHEHAASTIAAAAAAAAAAARKPRMSDSGFNTHNAGRRFSSMNDAGDAAVAALAAASHRSSISLRPTCHVDGCCEGGQGPLGTACTAAAATKGLACCAQQQQHAETAAHVTFASGMRRRSSNSSNAAGFWGAAGQPAATVVRLTSAALAAAAAAAEQQQQNAATTHASFSSTLDLQCSSQQQKQHAAPQLAAFVADGGDAVSSCCDGQSDLSALANPLAYADVLRQRMDKHLGPAAIAAAAAGTGAALAGAGVEDGSVTPRSAAKKLNEFIQGNKPLQQKAARLKLGLQQRQQKQQQQQQQQRQQQQDSATPAGLLSAPKVGATTSTHTSRFTGTSSLPFKPTGSSTSRQLAAAGAAGRGGYLNATAPAAVVHSPVLQAGLQLGQHQQQLAVKQGIGTGAAAASAANSSTGWHFIYRKKAAAAPGEGDGEPAYFNVDELKHDLERALRKVG